MKIFQFDAENNLTVIDGETQHDIQPEQLARHLVMFQDDMSPDELAKARAIIAGLA